MPQVPTPDEVNVYLAAHQLESIVEEAVNDAVLKQVKDPCRHIAEILMKRSEAVGESSQPAGGGSSKSISLDGPPPAAAPKRAGFAAVEVSAVKETTAATAASGDEHLNREFKTSSVELSAELDAKLKSFFDKMDADGNGEVSKAEAVAFWGSNFAKVNATSMFNEVDEDGNGNITWIEFRAFWQNVIGSGYSTDDLMEEVGMMLEGGSWVDFNDGRTT